mmetsp:Transcript_86842/g.202131  ORF Transcript_86842/g.202131 Transcript_86842/m.202131 type:complete len:122 (-) Transcript_86842:1083-1448(-)
MQGGTDGEIRMSTSRETFLVACLRHIDKTSCCQVAGLGSGHDVPPMAAAEDDSPVCMSTHYARWVRARLWSHFRSSAWGPRKEARGANQPNEEEKCSHLKHGLREGQACGDAFAPFVMSHR